MVKSKKGITTLALIFKDDVMVILELAWEDIYSYFLDSIEFSELEIYSVNVGQSDGGLFGAVENGYVELVEGIVEANSSVLNLRKVMGSFQLCM